MSNRFRHRSAIRCHYLQYVDPITGITFRLPMLHIKLIHGTKTFTTVGLVDSGATTNFIPTHMAEILELNLNSEPKNAVGAGGTFANREAEIDKLVLVKGRSSIFDEFYHVKTQIPVNPQAIPYVVLGRDTIFKRYDVLFEERNQKLVLKRHRA